LLPETNKYVCIYDCGYVGGPVRLIRTGTDFGRQDALGTNWKRWSFTFQRFRVISFVRGRRCISHSSPAL